MREAALRYEDKVIVWIMQEPYGAVGYWFTVSNQTEDQFSNL